MKELPGSLATIRACLGLIPRRLRLAWLAMIPLQLVGALAELAAAAVLFRTVTRIAAPAAGTGAAIDGDLLRTGALLLAGVFLLKNLWLAAAHLFHSRLLARSLTAAFRTVTGAWLAAPFAAHQRGRSADLIHNATEGIGVAMRTVLQSATGVLAEILAVLALAALLAAKAPVPVLAAGCLLVFLVGGILAVTRRLTHRWGAIGFELGSRIVEQLQQMGIGLREIKAFRRERRFFEAATNAHVEAMRPFAYHTALAAMPRLAIELVFVGAAVTLLWQAAHGTATADALPLFALFAYAGFRIIPSANRIAFGCDQLRHGAAGVERLLDHLRRLGRGMPRDEPTSRPLRSSIELHGVCYRHPGSPRPALQDVSIVIAKGECIGLAGPTGAGKSTLIDLLAGLIEPTGGSLLVDGQPYAHWIGSGAAIGYVAQTPWLLDATVAENVGIGLPADEIDPALVWSSLAGACLDDVVRALPEGLETRLGEAGARLSGGERQRLAIARALYVAPDLLLLDEATAALDVETERRVLASLCASGTTIFLAAHRQQALRACDRLILLDEGRATTSGTWDQMFAEHPSLKSAAQAERPTASGPR